MFKFLIVYKKKVYSCYQNHYKLIGIDSSRQTNTTIPEQINFTEKLGDNRATMLFIAEKQQKNYSKLFFRVINCNIII